jgi:hypothetical protein
MYQFLHKKIGVQVVILLLLSIYALYLIYFPSYKDVLEGVFFANHPWLIKSATALLLFLNLILIQLFTTKSELFTTTTYFPSIFFLSFLLAINVLSSISILLLMTFFLILLLFLNIDYTGLQSKNIFLFTGMLIALLALTDPLASTLLFFIVIVFIANKFTSFKDLLIVLIGFFSPLIYFFFYYYMKSELAIPIHYFADLQIFNPIFDFQSFTIFHQVAYILLIIVFLYVIVAQQQLFFTKTVMMRRHLSVVNSFALFMLIMLFVSRFSFREALTYLSLPCAILFSLFIDTNKNWIPKDITIVILMILLAVCA